ncbi:phage major capsid protein [Jeotgalibaca sp. MA1X17-3]|uniref:phage major capsid protein n=1 Tax=Jeotgalibaca sp. MA1X17-3 TaxID=2908211 RepID=UPI001F35A407|nr:phage major capsid protein [Jeotgalibaca sp. MA1X17-3]UJF15067.1 phage major capsid protein [Jeotgalibaca sp. MA1X17-3]
MPLKITDTTKNARIAFNNISAQDDATPEQVNAALENFVTAVSAEKWNQVLAEHEELKDVSDNSILQARGIHVLTAKETQFYNEAEKAGGFDKDLVWPETILERVFEDIQADRPLLKIINFAPSSAKTKIIRGRRKGVAVWGPLHKDLEGQLDAEFGASEFTQLALTAFFLISNDTLDLGPRWVDRFVRLCLQEAIAEAWEKVIIAGDGDDKPIGLLKDLDGSVTLGVYPDKASAGTLTFADSATMVKELAGVMTRAAKYKYKINKEDAGTDEYRKVNGKLYLIVNPVNYYEIVARVTTQNANGAFVTNLPFISQDRIIESLDVPANKLIAFVEGEYDASQSRAEKVYVYKETFAMKRATLYAVDLLGNGRPANNDAAQVYDIAIPTDVVGG